MLPFPHCLSRFSTLRYSKMAPLLSINLQILFFGLLSLLPLSPRDTHWLFCQSVARKSFFYYFSEWKLFSCRHVKNLTEFWSTQIHTSVRAQALGRASLKYHRLSIRMHGAFIHKDDSYTSHFHSSHHLGRVS